MREPTSPAEIESVLSAIWGKSGRQNGRQAEILSATQKIPKPLKGLGIRNAGDGGRTHTVSPPTDFESVSSANSNTPAQQNLLYVKPVKKASVFLIISNFIRLRAQKRQNNGTLLRSPPAP